MGYKAENGTDPPAIGRLEDAVSGGVLDEQTWVDVAIRIDEEHDIAGCPL